MNRERELGSQTQLFFLSCLTSLTLTATGQPIIHTYSLSLVNQCFTAGCGCTLTKSVSELFKKEITTTTLSFNIHNYSNGAHVKY